MDWGDQFAWALAAVGISLTASLILLGIWWGGVTEIVRDTGERKFVRDDGIRWMFLACMLWCGTYIADIVGLTVFTNLHVEHSSSIAFIRVVLSLTNSVFFLLATSNLDALKEDLSLPGQFLRQIRNHPVWIVASLILLATAFSLAAGAKSGLCQGLDASTNVLTILLLGWGFFRSFTKRRFPIIAWTSAVVFSIFLVAELGEFLNAITPTSLLARQQLFGTALSVATDGMVSLVFIAVTFSWVHEQNEKNAEIIDVYTLPEISDAKGSAG